MRQEASKRDCTDPETESILRAQLEAVAEHDPLVRDALHALGGNGRKSGRPHALGAVRQRNIALAVATRCFLAGNRRGDLTAAIEQVARETGYRVLSVKSWYVRHKRFANAAASPMAVRISDERKFAADIRRHEAMSAAKLRARIQRHEAMSAAKLRARASEKQLLLDGRRYFYDPALFVEYQSHASRSALLKSARILRDGSPSAVRAEEERIFEFVRAIKSTKRRNTML